MDMKVKQLITELSKLDPEALVVLSSDMEGNRFGELDSVDDNNMYDKQNHEITGCRVLTEQLKRHGYTDEDLGKSGVSAVVLWPNC